MNKPSEAAIKVLRIMRYEVIHPQNELHQLTLGGENLGVTFANDSDAWEYASLDLSRRARMVNDSVQSGYPDYQGEAKKLGFEVTVNIHHPKHGWRNRDLDVVSMRQDYPTDAEAWRAAFMWARRFAILWKDM